MSWKVSFLVSRTARETSLLSSTDLRQAVAYRDFCYRATASTDRQRTRTPPTQQRASSTRRYARNVRVAPPRAPPSTTGNEDTIVHSTRDGNQTEEFVTSNTGVEGVQSGIPGGVAPGRAGQLDGSNSPPLRRSSRVRRQNTERVQALTVEAGHSESIAGGMSRRQTRNARKMTKGIRNPEKVLSVGVDLRKLE